MRCPQCGHPATGGDPRTMQFTCGREHVFTEAESAAYMKGRRLAAARALKEFPGVFATSEVWRQEGIDRRRRVAERRQEVKA